MSDKLLFPVFRYSLVICKNKENKFLAVEQKSGKWWIPGGKVQKNETFLQAAVRQCKQQAGIQANIKGIIRVDYGKYFEKTAWRTIYYSQPIQSSLSNLKTKQDSQSKRAFFLSIQQIQNIKDKWRGRQLYDFPKYLLEGGQYYPLTIFKENFLFNQKMI